MLELTLHLCIHFLLFSFYSLFQWQQHYDNCGDSCCCCDSRSISADCIVYSVCVEEEEKWVVYDTVNRCVMKVVLCREPIINIRLWDQNVMEFSYGVIYILCAKLNRDFQ